MIFNKFSTIICFILNIFSLFLIIFIFQNQKYSSVLKEKLYEIDLELKEQKFKIELEKKEYIFNLELKQKENQIKQLQNNIRVYIIEKDSKDDSKKDDDTKQDGFKEIKID